MALKWRISVNQVNEDNQQMIPSLKTEPCLHSHRDLLNAFDSFISGITDFKLLLESSPGTLNEISKNLLDKKTHEYLDSLPIHI